MTRFVQVVVNLGHLPADVRSLVPDFDETKVPNGCDMPGAVFSTTWSIKGGKKLPTAITAAISLPKAFLSPSVAVGTSVFAAGRVGLELVRTALARAGLPKSALDNIGIAHVTLKKVSVTYVLRFVSGRTASKFKRLIHQHGLLRGLLVTSTHADNQSHHRIGPDSELSEQDALSGKLAGAALSIDWRPAGVFVYIGAMLEEPYLIRRGWNSLESWRGAYSENRYKTIFDMVMRGVLRLDGTAPQHPEPREGTIALCSLRHGKLLLEHIKGRDVTGFTVFPFKKPDLEKGKLKGWKVAQKAILEQTGVDIAVPWKQQQWHRPAILVKELVYPGDYAPVKKDKDLVAEFCAENWPGLLADLQRKYEEACQEF